MKATRLLLLSLMCHSLVWASLYNDIKQSSLDSIDGTNQEAVLDLLENLDQKRGSILSETSWRDLEVFGKESLLSNIDRTETAMGRAVLSSMIVSPTTDVKLLKTRQRFIKTISNDQKAFNAINRDLEAVSSAEKEVLKFWDAPDDLAQNSINRLYFKNTYLSGLNQSTLGMETSTRIRNFNTAHSFLAPVTGFVLYGAIAESGVRFLLDWSKLIVTSQIHKLENNVKDLESKSNDQYSPELSNAKWELRNTKRSLGELELVTNEMPSTFMDSCSVRVNHLKNGAIKIYDTVTDKQTYEDIKDNLDKWYNLPSNDFNEKLEKYAPPAILTALGAGACAMAYYFYYRPIKKSINNEIELNKVTTHLQAQMIALATYIKSMKSTLNVLAMDPIMTSMDATARLERLFEGKSAKVNKLLSMLNTNTFEGQPSFFSISGRTLAAHKIMLEIKDELIDALEAYGEIDAYMSVAKLYNEHLTKESKFSFVRYAKGERPYISLTDFWNPFIDADKVVKNSLEVNGKNAVITGPNAGGKSTVLKAVVINVILAQSMGISSSEDAFITPFSKINTYLNVVDDISTGNSLFKAEVLRAKELVNNIKSLDDDQFSLSIMDEMFSGTSPKEGSAASCMMAKSLGKCKNSLCLISTHFPEMSGLEDETGRFTNYKVGVIKNDDGSLYYPYKLETGVTDQHIAFDILANEGVIDRENFIE